MELKDLKKTWNQFTTGKELDEEQLKVVLQKRTDNLIDRIDRNVRFGFVILFILILIFLADDLIFAPMLANQTAVNATMPQWLKYLSIFSDLFILITFVFFVIKYYKVRRLCKINCNLREALTKIIETLQIYNKLFYLALTVFAIALAMQFISGMYAGLTYDIETHGIIVSDIPFGKWVMATVIGILVLTVTVGGIYLLMRWGFRRLYGNYINKLKQTLNELDEIDV